MTQVTISADDPRTIKALEIAAGASQWLRCRGADGQKAFGVPSQCAEGRYYLVTCSTCDCPDFKRHGLSSRRIGEAGSHHACKHILAVRLYCELVKAQQKPVRAKAAARTAARRGHLSVVPATTQAAAAKYDDIFNRIND